MSRPAIDRAVRWRLIASYVATFGVLLFLFAVYVRVVAGERLSGETSLRLHEIVEDAEEQLESRPHDASAALRKVVGPDEGVSEASLGGRVLVAIGPGGREPLGPDGETTATIGGQTSSALIETIDELNFKGRIRAVVADGGRTRTLQRVDLVLAAGFFVLLLLSVIGAHALAGQALRRIGATLLRLDEFTADAAHEMRGPLAAVLTNAEALQRSDEAQFTASDRRLAAITAAAHRLRSVLDDLLLLAQLDDTAEPELHVMDVAACVEDAGRTYAPAAAVKGVRLVLVVDQARGPTLGIPTHVHRIVSNLLDNAVRHTPAGGSVHVEARVERERAVVSVADTGTGIEPAAAEHVFERFWRADRAGSPGEGTGLGLAIARALARRDGGDVTLVSSPGRGSTFKVTLPLRGARTLARP